MFRLILLCMTLTTLAPLLAIAQDDEPIPVSNTVEQPESEPVEATDDTPPEPLEDTSGVTEFSE